MSDNKKVPLSISLDAEDAAAMREMARVHRTSLSFLVQRAVRRFLRATRRRAVAKKE